MTATRALALILICASLLATSARAEEPANTAELDRLYDSVARLERRIAELEGTKPAPVSAARPAAEWPSRIRLSGSAELDYLEGGSAALWEDGSTKLFDARVFLDADLGSDMRLGDATVFRDAGFAFELNLVRLGNEFVEIGDMYVDLRGLAGQDWLNLEFGRFQIPFGENYLRFGRGRASDPFIALTAAPPWFWDEGLKLWGKSSSGKVGYVFSLTDGENGFGEESNSSKQVTLKLSWDPSEWLHLSASGLRSGQLGSEDDRAVGALWLGETFPASFGAWADAPGFVDGALVADGPNELHDTTALGADAILRFQDARLWLSGGEMNIDSRGGSLYDRDVMYWMAELMLQLRMISPALAPLYLAMRANGLGTYDDDEGYMLDFRFGDSVGYNMKALHSYALALGLPLGDNVVLKAQYAIQNITLVDGVSDEIREGAENADFFGMEIGVHF